MPNRIDLEPNVNKLHPLRRIPGAFAVTLALLLGNDALSPTVPAQAQEGSHAVWLPHIEANTRPEVIQVSVQSITELQETLTNIESIKSANPEDTTTYIVTLKANAENRAHQATEPIHVPKDTFVQGETLENIATLVPIEFTGLHAIEAISLEAGSRVQRLQFTFADTSLDHVIAARGNSEDPVNVSEVHVVIIDLSGTILNKSAILAVDLDRFEASSLTIDELRSTAVGARNVDDLTVNVKLSTVEGTIVTDPAVTADESTANPSTVKVTGATEGFITAVVVSAEDPTSLHLSLVHRLPNHIGGTLVINDSSGLTTLRNISFDGQHALGTPLVQTNGRVIIEESGSYRVFVDGTKTNVIVENPSQLEVIPPGTDVSKPLVTLVYPPGSDPEQIGAIADQIHDLGFDVALEEYIEPALRDAEKTEDKESSLQSMREFLVGKTTTDQERQRRTSDAAAGQRRG